MWTKDGEKGKEGGGDDFVRGFGSNNEGEQMNTL